MVWRLITGSQAGDASRFGGDDLTKINNLFNGQVNVDSVLINSSWTFGSGFAKFRGSNSTNTYTINGSPIASNIGLTLPNATADDKLTGDITPTELKGKTFNLSNNIVTDIGLQIGDIAAVVDSSGKFKRFGAGTSGYVLSSQGPGSPPAYIPMTSGGGGGGGGSGTSANLPLAGVLNYDYFVYIEPSDGTYAALRKDGTIKTSTPNNDVGQLVKDIFIEAGDETGSHKDLVVTVGAGSYNQNVGVFGSTADRSRLTYQGLGSGVTHFKLASTMNETPFEISRGGTGSAVLLTSNCNHGDRSIVVADASTFNAGDYFKLRANDNWENGDQKGEMNRVVSKSGNTIYLEKYSRDQYTTSNGANIIKFNEASKIVVRGFTIEADPNVFGTNEPGFLQFYGCDQVLVDDVRIRNVKGDYHKCLILYDVINSVFSNMVFEQDPQQVYADANGPYAISLRAASEDCIFVNCRFLGTFRHPITTTGSGATNREGIPRGCKMIGAISNSTGECAFDTHGGTDGIEFIACSYNGTRSRRTDGVDDTDAFGSRSPRTIWRDCHAKHVHKTPYGPGSYDMIMENCSVEDGFSGNTLEVGIVRLKCSNYHVNHCTNNAITITDGCDDCYFSDLVIIDPCSDGTNAEIIRIDSAGHLSFIGGMFRLQTVSGKKAFACFNSSDYITIDDIDASGTSTSTFTGSNNKINYSQCRGV